jgi:hypothetical protein
MPNLITARAFSSDPEADSKAITANQAGNCSARSKRCSKMPWIEDRVENSAPRVSVWQRI